jgi:hypothetical protein
MAQIKNVSKVAQTFTTLGITAAAGEVFNVADEAVAAELAARPEFEAVTPKPAAAVKKEQK